MGKILDGLLRLQTIERELAHLRGRLRTRQNAVQAQERRIKLLETDLNAMTERMLERRKAGDRLTLDLRGKEEQVQKLRGSLNTAKTNKEYAAILTQINTLKADNSRLEEEALKIMTDVDGVKAETAKLQEQMQTEQKRLEEVRAGNAKEIEKLQSMLDDFTAKRTDATAGVTRDTLTIFDRIAKHYDGEAMAPIEIHGVKPPHDYICGGCSMSLNAEHANALRVRDEIRTCDNCGRILYLEPQDQAAKAAQARPTGSGMTDKNLRITIHVDGGSRGNPGPAGAAFVAADAADGAILKETGLYLGHATNNVAEYRGLLAGLEFAATMQAGEVDVFSDSELMVRQMNGQYRVRNAGLLPLFGQAKQLACRFAKCRFHHVPREKNTRADAMVNQALDLKSNVDGPEA